MQIIIKGTERKLSNICHCKPRDKLNWVQMPSKAVTRRALNQSASVEQNLHILVAQTAMQGFL